MTSRVDHSAFPTFNELLFLLIFGLAIVIGFLG